MIEYRDFQQQAEWDIKRAKELYEKEDYGFAAFSAQQGLEKYIKAYLMKFNLIPDPKNLGHLQFDIVCKLMIDQICFLKDDAATNNDPFFVAFFEAVLKSCEEYKCLIEDMKKCNDMKITTWKSSLKITLTQHEENISKGLDARFASIHSQLKTDLSKHFEILAKILPDIVDSLPEQDRKLFTLLLSLPNQADSDNSSEMIEEMITLIKPKLYGNSPDSMSKEDSDMMVRYFLLLRSFKWIDIAIDSYPHQEISRYPIYIDGLNSSELYRKNKGALLEFIRRIKNACEEIKLELNH